MANNLPIRNALTATDLPHLDGETPTLNGIMTAKTIEKKLRL